MKKILLLLLLIIPLSINAEDSYYFAYKNGNVNIRKGPSTEYEVVGTLYNYTSVIVHETKDDTSTNNNCPSKKWHRITYGNIEGYVCGNWLEVKEIEKKEPETEYDFETEIQKFPESYKKMITILHTLHPNWQIYAKELDKDFNKVVSDLSESSISLIQVTKNTNGYGYLWQDESVFDYTSNKYLCYDGCTGFTNYGWFIPNQDTIAYYLDPRNYLNEVNIFAFLNQKFSEHETLDVLGNLVKGTFMSSNYVFNKDGVETTKSYVETFYEAGHVYNVSPIMLIARSKQEILVEDINNDGIKDGSSSVTGNVEGYEGYYNFFNYGAFSGENPIINGLIYAKNNNWNSPYASILGGASKIANSYIKNNQYSLYLQKYNVINGIWTHQYMQNIQAPKSESYSSFITYYNGNMIDTSFVFEIPVFLNMPENTKLPSYKSPNNYLKNITIDGKDIDNFSSNKYEYTHKVEYNTTELEINAYKYVDGGKIEGIGRISLNKELNEEEITIKSIAENNDERLYKIKIERLEKPSDIVYPSLEEVMEKTGFKYNEQYISGINLNVTIDKVLEILKSQSKYIEVKYTKNDKNKTTFIATNDIITIKSGDNTYTFNVVLKGDIDGNGNIDLKDLLQLQKLLLNKAVLTETSKKAADCNTDSSITLLDLLKIQKHLLGVSIEQ